MSLSSSLSAALTGLTANARRAEIVSSNVANALTPGYGVRRVEVAAQTVGQAGAGVAVIGTDRQVDMRVLADRRIADGQAGAGTASAGFQRALENAIGMPQHANSLSSAIARFEGALIEAASRPESTARLGRVVSEAHALTDKIGAVSGTIGAARAQADTQIATTVADLNTALDQIASLNSQIRRNYSANRDVATLQDQRQGLIDKVAAEIPLQQVDRGRGEVALFSAGGVILLDGQPAQVGFTPRSPIAPAMTYANGALSGLTVNGRPLNPLATHSPIRGGRLEALFQIRDEAAPKAQARIDAVARDLIERHAEAAADPTLPAGLPGLFTDGGGPFDPVTELGLAARLSVNPLVDPAQGGDLWRVPDGIGAVSPGAVGDATQLQRLVAAVSAPRPQTSGDLIGVARTAATLVSDYLSMTSADRSAVEKTETFAAALAGALRQEELKSGVDTDFELQQLLMIEQSYAANARIVQVVGEMLETLSRL